MSTQFFRTIMALLWLLPQIGSAQQFGKNSVQYTNFDWHYLQSRHFDIYFYPGSEQIAEFVADVAESSYVSISGRWDYKLKDRIVFVLYKSHNDFGQTNLNFGPPAESVGGFTEFFKNRVVIPYEGSFEQLRHVTHHELTHAVMLQMMFGSKAFAIIAGISRSQIPLWFIEGLAEYESRGGWDSESDMFIRDAVISGYLPPINQLYGFLSYKGGQSVFNFIADKYGEQKVGEILRSVKFSKSVNRGLRRSIGIGVDELSAQWHKHLKQIYWPDFADLQEPEDIARPVTHHTKDRNFINNSSALSPQGDKVAYLSDKSGFFDIYVTSTVEEEKAVKLVSGQRSAKLEELHWLRPGITWSPDGSKIAFAAKSREQDALHIVDVRKRKISNSYKFDLDGVYSPDWSPDGNKITFVGVENGSSDIYIYDLQTQKLRQLNRDIFSDLAPRWSPDGQQIVFISDRGKHVNGSSVPNDFRIQDFDYHQFDIYLADVGTGAISRLTDTEANEKSPVWSPDGSRIAFVSDRSGISNIYVQELHAMKSGNVAISEDHVVTSAPKNGSHGGVNGTNGDGPYAITNLLTGADHLSWEGHKLAFTSFYRGGFDIYILRDPLKVKPGQLNPPKPKFLALKQKTIGNGDHSEIMSSVRETPSNRKGDEYHEFIFGEAFKRGRSLSADDPDPKLFLSESQYKSGAGKYRAKKYKTKFSPDIITGGAGYDPFFGFQGAAILSLSDLMGNHRINFLTDVFVDIKNSDFAVNYFYLPRQTDYGIGLFQFNYLFFSQGEFLVRDRNLGLNASLSRPFDRYRRFEFGVDFRYISRDRLVDLSDTQIDVADRSTRVFLTRFNYIKDNVLWGFTGPRAGSRFNFSVQASADFGPGNLDFRIYQFDYRTYLNFKRNYTFAFRLSAGLSEGRHRQKFFLGGMTNWINLDFREDIELDLNDLYFSNLITPLRGFDYYQQVGSKFFLGNMELRIPFVNYFDMTWPLPLRFSNIRGSLFLDIGSAWDQDFRFGGRTSAGDFRLDDVLMSFGWGTRVNVGIFLLKYDIAWRTDLAATTGARHLFSIGADF